MPSAFPRDATLARCTPPSKALLSDDDKTIAKRPIETNKAPRMAFFSTSRRMDGKAQPGDGRTPDGPVGSNSWMRNFVRRIGAFPYLKTENAPRFESLAHNTA